MWTERIPCAYPVALIESANALAAIIDPDSGGANTFTLETVRGNYVYAEIPFKTHFLPIVQGRDPETWQAAIAQLAAEKGVEPLPPETIELLRSSLLMGDECSELEHG